MRPHHLIMLAAFSAVLSVDTVTKAIAPHDGWTWHTDPLSEPGRPSALMTVVVLASGVIVSLTFRSIGFAVALAGALGNIAWATTTGGTPNPFVDMTLSDPHEAVAFNVADIAVQGGAVFGALELSIAVALLGNAAWSRRRGRAILPAP